MLKKRIRNIKMYRFKCNFKQVKILKDTKMFQCYNGHMLQCSK